MLGGCPIWPVRIVSFGFQLIPNTKPSLISGNWNPNLGLKLDLVLEPELKLFFDFCQTFEKLFIHYLCQIFDKCL
jgi:hypothetical protein